VTRRGHSAVAPLLTCCSSMYIPIRSKRRRPMRATTAWDFSQDLEILGVDLGFRDFTKLTWDFLTCRK